MKKELDCNQRDELVNMFPDYVHRYSIGDLINLLEDQKAYFRIGIFPNGHHDLYLSWWDDDHFINLEHQELIDSLFAAVKLVYEFRQGNNDGWRYVQS